MIKKFFLSLLAIFVTTVSVGQEQKKGKYTNLDGESFAKKIENLGVIILDVRTPEEFKQSHMPRAINIDIKNSKFDKKISKLDKKRPIAVYCRSGKRSEDAAKRLAEKGYTVYNLIGGLLEWKGVVVHPRC